MIFDGGAGTTDISILEKKGNITTLESKSYSTTHGGADIDIEILKYVMPKFKNLNVRTLMTPVVQKALKNFENRSNSFKGFMDKNEEFPPFLNLIDGDMMLYV